MSEHYRPRVDFHIHYDPMDEKSAFSAIDVAQKRNVIAMTLLARSEVSPNFSRFIDYGDKRGVEVVPGVEHLVVEKGKSIDLICLGFNPYDQNIQEYFGQQAGRLQNIRFAKFQINFLESKGFDLSNLSAEQFDLLKRILHGEITEKAIKLCEIVSGVETNHILIERLKRENQKEWSEVVDKYSHMPNYKGDRRRLTAKFLWTVFFDVDKEGFIPISKNTEKVINIVHSAGGVVLYSPEGSFNQEIWDKLKGIGIDGVMAWHAAGLGQSGRNVPDVPWSVARECRKRQLLILGGSDYQQKDWEIGVGNGNMYINPRRYEELKNYLRLRNNGDLPWRIVNLSGSNQ